MLNQKILLKKFPKHRNRQIFQPVPLEKICLKLSEDQLQSQKENLQDLPRTKLKMLEKLRNNQYLSEDESDMEIL